jgi:hypothetical protein
MAGAFTELRAAGIAVRTSCVLTGRSRATHYRQAAGTGPRHGPWLVRTPPPATLSAPTDIRPRDATPARSI